MVDTRAPVFSYEAFVQVRTMTLELLDPRGVPEDQIPFLMDDRNVGRYITARNGDLQKAASSFASSINFRSEKKLDPRGPAFKCIV